MAEFQEVLRQRNRMCKAMGDTCLDCELNKFARSNNLGCLGAIVSAPHTAETIIMDWAAEHPEKTMKDVLLEKFPKAMLREDGMPCACVAYLGLGKCIDNCAKHWRSPAPEE